MGYLVRQHGCKVANELGGEPGDEPGPWVPRHHPVRLKVHLHFGPRAARCSVWVSSRAPCARTARARWGSASRRPIPKNGRKFGVFMVFRGSGAHAHRVLAVVVAGAARRWVRVMERPMGAPLEVNFQPFLALKNPIFRPFGSRNASETAENGWRNGRVSAKI
jgi:hypothetical protein